MILASILGWAAWGMAPLTVFLYGQSQRRGAGAGVLTALLFIAWGLVAGIPAAALTNVLFVILHVRNLWRSLHVDARSHR